MNRRLLFFAPLALLAFALFITLGGEVVKALWNALLPALFGFPRITFWQALGLLVLCRILFGGFRLGDSHRSSRTPEERERMRQRIRAKFGFGPSVGASHPPTPAAE